MPGANSDRLINVRAVIRPQASQDVAAWGVVRRHLAITPVVRAPQLGPNVSLKLETFQPTGSFKVRGGLAAVAATLQDDSGREVVGASAGNHGLGGCRQKSMGGAWPRREKPPTPGSP
jgi:threonine dehydratase